MGYSKKDDLFLVEWLINRSNNLIFKVKKFNYDLIEEAAPKSKNKQLFCSAFCFNNRLLPTKYDVTGAKEKNLTCLAFELASIIRTFNRAVSIQVKNLKLSLSISSTDHNFFFKGQSCCVCRPG